MKKSILISIRPEWVAKILNGDKTIEIRKTAPKCELPVTVYIYCTQGKEHLYRDKHGERKFFCHKNYDDTYSGKVVAKFTLDEVFFSYLKYCGYGNSDWGLIFNACLTIKKMNEYLSKKKGGKSHDTPFYAWHITNLEIFDQPKDLSDFGLKRAPQSWQYVEVEK